MADSSNKRTTLDKGEVERHSVLSDWWDLRGTLRGLHTFNTLRVPLVVDSLVLSPENRNSPNPLKGKKILDIGCGAGIVSEALAKLGADVTGVDAGSTLIEMAKEHSENNPDLANNKPKYICATIEEHALEFANYYDAVVASEIVDHVADVELFLSQCIETLKPGGKIFITTPNRTRLSQLLVIFVAENILYLVPKGIHKYENFRTPAEVSAILAKYNCEVNDSRGIFFNPLTGKWWWVYFLTMWYALVATKLS